MTFSPNRSGPKRPGVLVLVLGGLGLAYPFVVYGALGRVPAAALVVAALTLVAGRLILLRRAAGARSLLPALLAVFAITAGLGLMEAELAARLYPVVMSLGMAAAFGLSLLGGPSLVEGFAALTEPDPSASARAYMRQVTKVWCGILVVNAGLSGLTALSGDLALWTLYNGLLSYLLMGTVFAEEYAIRRRVRAREAAR